MDMRVAACFLFAVVVGIGRKAQGDGCESPVFDSAITLGDMTDDTAGEHIRTSDGGTVYVGSFSGTVDLDPGPSVYERVSNGNEDVFVLKLDSSGSLLWSVAIGGTSADYATSVAEGLDGTLIVGGSFGAEVDFDSSDESFVLSVDDGSAAFGWKLSRDGNFEWAGQIGGGSSAYVYDLAVAPEGSIVILGDYNGPADLNPGSEKYEDMSTSADNLFLTALDSENQFRWARSLNNSDYLQGYAITIGAQNIVVFGGLFFGTMDFDPDGGGDLRTASPVGDSFLSAVSFDGEYLWTKNIGGINQDALLGLASNGGGDVVAVGSFSNLVDFDPSDGIDVKGSNGKKDVFVTKYDVDGNYQWTWVTGGSGFEEGYGVALDADGGIYLTGLFSGSNGEPGYEVDFDPSEEGVDIHVTGGDDEMFITHLQSDGSYWWTLSTFGESLVYGASIAVGADGKISVAGEFYDTADLDPTDGEALYSSAGANDVFLITLNCADEPLPCAGDVNYDLIVDPLDSGYVLARLGCPVGTGDALCDAADANLDGVVDPLDTGYVMSRFGACP